MARCLLLLLVLGCLLGGTVAKEGADKAADKPKKCKVFAVNGFEHNEWINTWFHFWRHNKTCSDSKRRCYAKPLDTMVQVTNLHRAMHRFLSNYTPSVAAYIRAVPDDDGEGNVAFLIWHDNSWYVSTSSGRPNEKVYAQLVSSKKKPTSSDAWEVYNGSIMVKNNVTVTYVDDTLWLHSADLSVLVAPYAFGLLAALYFLFLCMPQKESPPKAAPASTPQDDGAKEEQKKDQ